METNVLRVILILFNFVVNSDDLHGSSGPLTARLGGAVLLPCFVNRPLPLEELEVEWRRTDSGTIVHLFQGGQSRPESQGDAYRGRAHFFSQEIPKGNFSLLLEGVRTADAGVYKCVVYTAQERHETQVEIQELEWLVVTGADEPVYAHAGEDVTLSCSVDTHVNVTELQVKWRKTDDDEDIIVLLYADGENRPESQDERYSGRAEFFIEEIPKGNLSMKLWKVRMEDKGEFRCEVHSDTDSANTTARIAALGYFPLRWLILGLCITVMLVVLLTGALSVFHLIREGKSRLALLSHCLHGAVPPIMVSAAFILWGVAEGSTEEAFTCSVISLLTILMLFNMAPYTDKEDEIKYTTLSLGSTIFITAVCAGSLIEFSAKYSPTPTEKVIFGGISGGIYFLVIVQILCVVLRKKDSSVKIRGMIEGITAIIFLVIMVSSIIALSIYLERYHPDAAWKEQLGTFTISLLPFALVSFSCAVFVYQAICSRRTTGEQLLRDTLSNFLCHARWFNMLFLAIYSHLVALMQNTFILGYSVPLAVLALGIWACIYYGHATFYYLTRKILLLIFFMLHLILSFLYLSVILENDKGQPLKICEFLFICTLIVTSSFRSGNQKCLLAKPRKFLYFSGAFGLPLLNSVALAVELKFKADTGKQPVDLQLIVLISGSVFLFSWFVIQMSAYCLAKMEKLEKPFIHQKPKDPEPDQNSCDSQEMEVLSPADPSEPNTKKGSHDNEETESLSPTDHNGPNTEEGTEIP